MLGTERLFFEHSMEEFVYSSPPLRKLFDWKADPIKVPDLERSRHSQFLSGKFNDMQSLDAMCQKVLASPTIQAMLQYAPYIKDIPISYRKNTEGEKENVLGSYRHGDDDEPDTETRIFIQHPDNNDEKNISWHPGTLGHEFRHAWHRKTGIFRVSEMLPVLDHVALTRVYEADSTVMKFTIAAELRECTGDRKIMDAVWGQYKEIAPHFEQEIWLDPNSLWDGRAQKALFLSYLSRWNIDRLTGYDWNTCMKRKEDVLNGTAPKEKLGRSTLMKTVPTLFSMPYRDIDSGELIERQSYAQLKETVTRKLILENLLPSIRSSAHYINRGCPTHFELRQKNESLDLNAA